MDAAHILYSMAAASFTKEAFGEGAMNWLYDNNPVSALDPKAQNPQPAILGPTAATFPQRDLARRQQAYNAAPEGSAKAQSIAAAPAFNPKVDAAYSAQHDIYNASHPIGMGDIFKPTPAYGAPKTTQTKMPW